MTRTPPRMSLLLAVFAGACTSLALGLGPASGQNESQAESRAVMEQSCRDGGMDEAACACLGDFVVANFTDRELAGAALVFSDPLLAEDPGAAVVALESAGYSLDEITDVFERVVSLEETAKTTCAVDAPADVSPEAE